MRRIQRYFILLCTIPVPLFLYISYNPRLCCSAESESNKRWFFIDSMNSLALQFYVHKDSSERVEVNVLPQTNVNKSFQINHKTAKKTVQRMCNRHKRIPHSLKSLTKKQRRITLSHLIVNDEYKFIYCYTPKVACSNWKRIMKVLYGQIELAENIQHIDHAHGFKYLSNYPESEMEEKLKTYYKFMFVRNPLERALSVYRNKFNDIETFRLLYGSEIARMMHHDSEEQYRGKSPGDDISFVDFIKYITFGVEVTEMNEHWTPMSTLCQPCAISYDFIGTYDNIEKESEMVLRAIHAPPDLHFPQRQKWYNPTTNKYMEYYFSLLQPALLRNFALKYFADFKLFSYPLPINVTSRSELGHVPQN
uniref:Carbohydrate sulfotransferase n=1 Tax=Ciona savignyi TaxID=51511 RepID=H2YVM7_CIOSA